MLCLSTVLTDNISYGGYFKLVTQLAIPEQYKC